MRPELVVRVLPSLVSLPKVVEDGSESRGENGRSGIFRGEGAEMAGPVACLLARSFVVDGKVHAPSEEIGSSVVTRRGRRRKERWWRPGQNQANGGAVSRCVARPASGTAVREKSDGPARLLAARHRG